MLTEIRIYFEGDKSQARICCSFGFEILDGRNDGILVPR